MGLGDTTPREIGQSYERGLDSDRNRLEDSDPEEVQCVACGTVQGFAGWDVACEECGGAEWEPHETERLDPDP